MGLSVEIDKFTPCLMEKATGKLIDTVYSLVTQADIELVKQKGWNFDWSAEDLEKADIYKLMLENDNETQG